MEIHWDGRPYHATIACHCDANEYGEPGMWTLHLTDEDTGATTDGLVAWPPRPVPVSLVERYDALAAIGFAVVQGGPDAWTWRQATDDQGRTYLVGATAVRPLTDAEAADSATPEVQRYRTM